MSLPKIDVKQARHDVEAGDALLVCAYDSREKFDAHHLEGARSLDKLREQEESIPKERELIFYCA